MPEEQNNQRVGGRNLSFLHLFSMLMLALVVLLHRPAQAETSSEPSLTLVALGTSLTAGYRLGPDEGFPEQLQQALRAKGHNIIVNNAGVSGDTSTGGLARLDWAVAPDTDAVIIELGSNDALRGVDPAVTRQNIETIITTLKDRGIEVMIAGMLAPPNMGPDYAADFNPIYPDLAQKYELPYYPFFLDGVAAQPELNLADGIHPTAEGIGIIVSKILPTVEQLIDRTKAARRPAHTQAEVTDQPLSN